MNWPEIADRLARRFWPGPLTLVLEKQPAIPDIVTANLSTVGLRMPAHPIALALIRAAGVPLAAPSANRFTELSPTTAEHVRGSFGSDVDYILDGGPCTVGIESTVLSLAGWSAGSQPILLRPGGIPRTEIESLHRPNRYGGRSGQRPASRSRHAPAPLQPADHFISSDEWKIARSGPRAEEFTCSTRIRPAAPTSPSTRCHNPLPTTLPPSMKFFTRQMPEITTGLR